MQEKLFPSEFHPATKYLAIFMNYAFLQVDQKQGARLITALAIAKNGKFAVVGTFDGRCVFYTTEVGLVLLFLFVVYFYKIVIFL